MSRVGNMPIAVPAGVQVNLAGSRVEVSGPKGKLEIVLPPVLSVEQESGSVLVRRRSEYKQARALHGLFARLIRNMMVGVTAGYSRRLEIVGVGYRAQLEGKKLLLQLGYSHPIEIDPPAGLVFQVEGNQKVVVSGCDKGLVGEMAARIRRFRPPEPYKGKGVRYEGEWVRRKAGKALA